MTENSTTSPDTSPAAGEAPREVTPEGVKIASRFEYRNGTVLEQLGGLVDHSEEEAAGE